jgi:hypothetical protein
VDVHGDDNGVMHAPDVLHVCPAVGQSDGDLQELPEDER